MRALVLALLAVAGTAYADEPAVPEPAPTPEQPPPVEAPRPVAAPAYQPPSKDIVITAPGERTSKNLLTLGAIAGAGLVVGAVGLYYNLDARDASNQVSASTAIDPIAGAHGSGRTWSTADQALVDRAHDSTTKAAVFYSIGGAALVGAVIAYIVTAPADQTSVIHTHVGVSPTGAMVFGSF